MDAGAGRDLATTTAARPQPRFDAAFDAAMARYHLPGTRGRRDRGRQGRLRAHAPASWSPAPASRSTPDTLFKIASNSKAMTAERAGAAGRCGQAALGRSGGEAPAAVPHARPVGHARDAGARPADPQQRPARGRRRPDAVAGAEPLHPRRHHRRAGAHQAGLQLPLRLRLRQPAVRRRRRSRGRGGRRAVRRTGAARSVRAAGPVALPGRCIRPRRGRQRRAAAHAHGDGRTRRSTNADDAIVPAITSAAAGGIRCSLDDMLRVGAATGWCRTRAQPAWLSPTQRSAMWQPRTPMPISARRARLGQHPCLRLRLRLPPGRCRWRVDGVAHRHAVGHVFGDDAAAGPAQRFRRADQRRWRRSAHRAERSAGQALHRAGAGRHRRRVRRTHRRRTGIHGASDAAAGHVRARAGNVGGTAPVGWARGAIRGSARPRLCARDGTVRFAAAKSPELRGQVDARRPALAGRLGRR